MDYHFQQIERNWQKYWAENKTFKASTNSDKPKFYALDMFPYPSGAGLHVGHPLGYIASDIYSRYKRLKGFNVLHPMGYDSFGLPAEQYAIQTGQHPAVTTKVNIEGGEDKNGNKIPGYRKQLDQLGFSFDWDRQVKTSDPKYYKWTQWIFLQLFDSWYNNSSNKAERISTLITEFAASGNTQVNAACDETETFSAEEWKSKSEEEQQTILLNYRLTFLSEAIVNWCPELGTVLANDEVIGGVSERGGYPVVQKKMTQWSMRITAYAERLLQGLDTIDWSDSIKEIQRNWIGKSVGAMVQFAIDSSLSTENHEPLTISVFTTRPDTIFGATYMTLAPEHELVSQITTPAQKEAVDNYVSAAAKKSERDRMSDVKTISGEFTGAYALHPFSGEKIPIWIGDYVLASYGTGAVMAVPAHDSRDYAFAKHFNIPIVQVVDGGNIEEESYDAKEGKLMNSDFLNGLNVKKAIKLAIYEIEKRGLGEGKTNYRLRDAVFGRQRYWGEPIPMYYKNGIPYPIDEKDLPLKLPEIDKYLPTEDGEPPLARADNWKYFPKGTSRASVSSEESNLHPEALEGYDYEHSTMPGWAGSSWYFLRYMDSANEDVFVDKDLAEYWNQIDLYIGGAEHSTGHLLYFRFWTKFFNDMGYINF
ncbi:MAG: leucine--tRNA ligase, partial [Flavobacteriales bacterium]|nr:leucine--tRNA ligase [Flavobacteriales bacterium]